MQGQTKCWHHFCPANLTMVQNKLEHCLLGMGVCAFGIVGYSQGWLGAGKMLFLIVAVLGGFWAYVIGHAWMVVPWLILMPFCWLYERLDPREPARIRRKAAKLGYSAITAHDLRYYGHNLGHAFVWWQDKEGHVAVEDTGPRNRIGREHAHLLGVGRNRAIIIDLSRNRKHWEKLLDKTWLCERGI